MFNKKLAYKIKKILFENKDKYLRIKEIAELIHIKKHQHKELSDTLFQLAKEKKIIRQGHSYKSRKTKKSNVKIENRYLVGKFDATSLARNHSFAFVITPDFDVMIHGEDIGTAYHNDEVKVEITYQKGNRYHGRIINIIKRGNETIVGTVDKYKNQYLLVCDSNKIHTNLLINKIGDAQINQMVVVKVTNWGTRRVLPTGNVVEILGDSDDPEVEVLAIIRQNNLPLKFPDDVLEEADEIVESTKNIEVEDRHDLRDLLTFTIDPISAKDYDDAVSLEIVDKEFKLYVHIADVAYYIHPKSKIFKEAVKRGNSFYFPKQVIPMLPEKISNGVCSLRPFEDKRTVTAEFLLDENFKVKQSKVYPSIICSNERLNYEQVDKLFEDEESDISEEVQPILHLMREISHKFSKLRFDEGYINFNLPDTKFIYDDDGELVDFQRDEETDSHKLIENFMLLANEFVAKYLTEHAEHTIYRIHEKPEIDEVNSIIDILQKNGIDNIVRSSLPKTIQNTLAALETEENHRAFDRMILRSMKKAKYSHQRIEHFGLGMETYTHFTSPIRRLCDLIIHHQLRSKFNKTTQVSFSKIKKYSEIASEQEMLAQSTERAIEFVFERRFMKDRIGDEFTAVVTGMNQAVVFVELDRYPIRGVVRMVEIRNDYFQFNEDSMQMKGKKSGIVFKLGSKLSLTLSKVEEEIIFSLKETDKHN